MTQKFANYRLRLVILGDVSAHVKRSEAFADFVREANRGDQLWFAADVAALDEKLSARRG